MALDQGRHGGSLAAACSPGEEDESLASLGENGERLRKVQRLERGNLAGKNADRGGDRSALEVDVGAKSSGGSAFKAKVQTLLLIQLFEPAPA